MPRLAPETIARMRDENPLDAIVGARTPLGRPNGKGIRAGQCLCAPDRTKKPLWVDCAANTFGCLKPGGCGGDVFDYLERFEGLTFADSLRRLGGATDLDADPEIAARLAAERAEAKAERARLSALDDEDRRAKAFEIWERGRPSAGTLVDAYLRHRGIEPWPTRSLRFSHDEPFWTPPGREGDRPILFHRGPCMLAAIQAPDGKFCGVHRTWLDVDLAKPPAPLANKGKAHILLPDGTKADVKKMRGPKKRGAIRLSDLRCHADAIDAGTELVLVVGEGIETTATALQALARHGRRDTIYIGWAAGDLGNIAGGGLGPSTRHPTRPGLWVPSPDPDPSDPSLLPPSWATRAILLGDGDSDAVITAARLACGKARFEAAGCPTTIRMAPRGRDFNDLATSGAVMEGVS